MTEGIRAYLTVSLSCDSRDNCLFQLAHLIGQLGHDRVDISTILLATINT